MDREKWKCIEGYEGRYQISNKGRVRSTIYNKHRIRKTSISHSGSGYECVVLSNNGSQKCHFVHRLVAKAFIPNPENKPHINHKDGNKLNNNANNVEWCTHQENVDHSVKTGLYPTGCQDGLNNHMSKFDKNDILDIRNAYRLGCFTRVEIADAYNVSSTTIDRIVDNQTYKNI